MFAQPHLATHRRGDARPAGRPVDPVNAHPLHARGAALAPHARGAAFCSASLAGCFVPSTTGASLASVRSPASRDWNGARERLCIIRAPASDGRG
jgi:hypothetical protein